MPQNSGDWYVRQELTCLSEADEVHPTIREFISTRVPAAEHKTWRDWCIARVKPARQYMAEQESKHGTALRLYEAAALWVPHRFAELKHSTTMVAEILSRCGRFFAQEVVDGLLREMSTYNALCESVAKTANLAKFWHDHSDELPTWFYMFKRLGLIQPSSAVAERGFSVFNRLYGDELKPHATEQLMDTHLKAVVNPR